MQRASCPAAAGAQGMPLRWGTERSPAQRSLLHRQGATPLCRRRRQRAGEDLACRTLEPGRLLLHPGGSGNFGGGGYSSSFGSGASQSCLLAFQPGSGGGGGDLSQADVSGFLGNGSGGRGLPKETFQQLRQAAAVLTSLDLADNAEHTVDYEDGSAELAEDILLESCPSAKEVGKSVFEVRTGGGVGGRSGAGSPREREGSSSCVQHWRASRTRLRCRGEPARRTATD